MHLLRTVAGAAEGYVVGDGVVEEDAVLRHEAYLCPEAVDVQVADRDSVNKYVALCAVVETGEEVDECGLAGSGRTYYGNGLPARDGEVDVAEHIDGVGVGSGAVGEGYIAVFYSGRESVENNRMVFLNNGFVSVHDFKDADGGGIGFLQVVVYAHNGLDGRHKAGKEDDEEDEDRGEEFALKHGEAAENEDEGKPYGEEHFGEGTAELAACGNVYHAAGVGLVGVVETVGAELFLCEGFDGADAGERLFEDCEEVSETRLPFGGTAAQAAADNADEPYGHRHDNQEIQEKARTDEYEYGGEYDDVDGVFAEGDDGCEYTPFNVGEVVGHAADDVAPAAGVEVGDREYGDFVVNVVAQAHDDAVAHGADDELRGIAAQVGEKREGKIDKSKAEETCPLPVASLEKGEGVGHEERQVFLAKRERRQLDGLGRTEYKFDEGNNGDEGEKVEDDSQHIEEQIGCYVPGIELCVAEDSPDIVHGVACFRITDVAG